MDEQEDIKKLQSEIERLTTVLHQCQMQINELQQRLFKINDSSVKPAGTYSKPSPPSYQHHGMENFIGLRLIHLAGIVVLVIGLSIGVKYAIDKNLVSEGMRITLAYVAGFVLYFFSFRLKKNYAGFSAILFSGAMASLYFTTYAAFVYYAIFSFSIAFVLMVGLTVFTVYQAITYNRQEIALLGLVGAYAIPFLVSKNADRAELFFLYISLINLAVVFLSVKKNWKGVRRAAQAITWLLFIGWASVRYEVADQGIGFLFMAFFFFLYLLNALSARVFHRRSLTIADANQLAANNLALYISSILIFAASFSNQDISTVIFALAMFTGAQALAIFYLWKEEVYVRKLLYSLSGILLIIFIAFRWDGLTVTLLWLLTAVVSFSWGIFKRSVAMRMAAIILMGITLLKLLVFDSITFSPVQKIISYVVLGVLLLVVSFFYQKFKQQLFGEDSKAE